ncbi:MAG: hypothetical protein WEA24_13340 [Gemmatimonadota bacterium]
MRTPIRHSLLPAAVVLALAGCGAGTPDADAEADADASATETQMATPPADATEQTGDAGSATGGAATAAEGNAPGTFIPVTDTWDSVRDGLHVVLSYDEGLDAFKGMITNNTSGTLCRAQVSVQLENGPDLGPSAPVDLNAGAARPVEIRVDGEPVEFFAANSMVQDCG